MIKVKIMNKSDFDLPAYETKNSAGMDLKAFIEEDILLKPLERKLIPTGLYMEIPSGYEGQIRARSGLAIKHGICLANGIGTIDSDYRGEVKVILINLGRENFIVKKGDRIAQLILNKYEKVEFETVKLVEITDRNTGGFGHTGV